MASARPLSSSSHWVTLVVHGALSTKKVRAMLSGQQGTATYDRKPTFTRP